MTETTDLLNAGELVESLGQMWTFSHVTPRIRASFSAAMKSRARKELSEQRSQGLFDGDDYRESLSLLNEEMAAGAYNWGSPLDPLGMGSAIRTWLGQTEGKIKLVQLLLEPKHGVVPAEKIIEIMADQAQTVSEAIARCLSVTDPNAKTPAKA